MKYLILGVLFPVTVWAQALLQNGEIIKNEEEVFLVPAIQEPMIELQYSWSDFLTEKNCFEDLKQFQNVTPLTKEQEDLKTFMQHYCIPEVSVWNQLSNTFRQEKKKLIIHNILNRDKSFIRYLKVIPYFLFDIHKTKPVDQSLYSKLDRIQNAIQNKRPELASALILEELSQEEQSFFISFLNELKELVKFKNLLNSKCLNQGGSHD